MGRSLTGLAPMGGLKDAKHKRMRVMMENAATFSDVEFLVGPEQQSFLGLKAIFARASEVFSKMFFEAGFREQTAGSKAVVHISDILPGAFGQLHRWVYDMDVELTCENVFGVFAAAQKYMVEDLDLYCRQWVATTARTADGVMGLYAAAAAGSWASWTAALAGRAKSFGVCALTSPALAQLPFQPMAELLQGSDSFATREEQVFEAAKAWSNGAAERGEDPKVAWQRVLDAEVVRFHLLDQRYFAEKVVLPGLLSEEQALAVFMAMSLNTGPRREVSLLGKLRTVLGNTTAEDAASSIEAVVDLWHEEGYSRALAQCLVERALADHENCCEWVSMWSELWGALRAAGLRDECVRATVDYCQNLFEDEPPPDSLVGVWICPTDTLNLVRILCKLNDLKKLAVCILMKVLEVLVQKTEEGTHLCCEPAAAASELEAHLTEVATRVGHLPAFKMLQGLRDRFAKACRPSEGRDWLQVPGRGSSDASPDSPASPYAAAAAAAAAAAGPRLA